MTAPVAVADVVIVGSGIIGLATAERLVAQNLSVVVVDSAGIAGGVSGVSGGLVRAYEQNFPELAREGLDTYLRQGWRGRWPAVREVGSMMLFDGHSADRAHQGASGLTAAGHQAEVLSAKQIHARFSGISVPSGFVGLYEPRAGWLPARAVAEAMANDAGDGLTLLDSVSANQIVTSDGVVTGVHTTAGYIQAKVVLLAAGVGSAVLARTAGVSLPLRTRAVSYCVFRPRRSGGGLPSVVDTTTGAWLRPWSTPDAVLAGVTSTQCDVPQTVTEGVSHSEENRVRRIALGRCPAVAAASLVAGATAYDAMSPEGTGAIKVWDEPAGLVTATGWNGGGFKLAPAVGRRVADRIRKLIAEGR